MESAIAKNLAEIGAISLQDYIDGHCSALPFHTVDGEHGEGNAVTQLHEACQRAFRSTDPLKFEFIEQPGSKNKQCIVTITKPDGAQRSYATQPVFAKKNEAKSEAAKIAIDMGALVFIDSQTRPTREPARATVETSSAGTGAMLTESTTAPESSVDDIEKCCLEWRAGCITPHWVPFVDPKLPHKQGCALRIQLSPHVARIYLSDSTFDTHVDAKGACATAAVLEGVLDLIKYGNGQTRPSSPAPSISSSLQSPPAAPVTPWTLQTFYDSLPRPFPESFETNNASEINALAWMNNMTQNAKGGKLVLSFFFTSDGPPGLHGCLLKVDRLGEYKAFIVDARFPKRSDAKAAVCLQAMSEGIGNYIRSIISVVDSKITPKMRSFSSSLVQPALNSALNKIDTELHPRFEYNKERNAFGAALVVRLSTSPTSEQVRRYTVPNDYRNKADAKVAVICHAAEQGVVEFVRFWGGPPPDGYVSPYSLHSYNPEASRKRKQPGSVEDADQTQPAKRKKKKGKQCVEGAPHGEVGRLDPVGQCLSVRPSGNQIHAISGSGDMGLSHSVLTDDLYDLSQPVAGSGSRPGAARPAAYGSGASYASSYPAVLNPRFSEASASGSYGYGVHQPPGADNGPSHTVDVPPFESGPSRALPGSSTRKLRQASKDTELEPGEVMSSAESEFSVGSSRHEDDEVPANERGISITPAAPGDPLRILTETDPDSREEERESPNVGGVAGRSHDNGEVKETSPANASTTVSQDGPGTTTRTTTAVGVSHVENLINHCARHGCDTPSFHELRSQGRYLVWIAIGRERYDLPTTYGTAEEGRERVAKQVLAWLSKGLSG